MSAKKTKNTKKIQQDKQSKELEALGASHYEQVGRALESIVISGYHSTRRLVVFNLLRGLVFGIGSALGATVVLVIIVWLLSLFSDLPFIGDLFQSAQDTVRDVNTN